MSTAQGMEHWAKKLIKQLNDDFWFRDWSSTGEENILQRKTDLTAAPGHNIHFGLLPRLTGAGKTGDTSLEGNEESMTFYGDTVSVQQYRHAVVWPGMYYVQKIPFDTKSAMNTALRIWAQEKYDGIMFSALESSPTHVLTVGGYLAETSMTLTNSELDIATIRKLPYLAKQQRIRPVKSRGRDYYVLLMHDQASLRLQQQASTNSQTWYQTMLYARERDSDNPLFSGAMGMVGSAAGSVLLHTHDNANLKGSTTAVTRVCYNLLLGARAGLLGGAAEPWLTEKKFDYGKRDVLATGFMIGCMNAQFGTAMSLDDDGVDQVKYVAPTSS